MVGNKPRKLQRGCLNCSSPLPLARNIASEYRFQGAEVAENEIEREGGGCGGRGNTILDLTCSAMEQSILFRYKLCDRVL